MKTLVLKETRENVKLAVLGIIIYTLILLMQYRGYVKSPTNMSQPLAEGDLLWSTVWFGGIFGAVLGWLQIHNERRPDLWAFLLHRPLTRTEIFLGKTLAGLGLYAVVVGVPLLGFIAWARWPGHVAAPFEWTMLRPLAANVLSGAVFYFAGMLTGLRQARWYASRALGLGAALIVCLMMQVRAEWWQGFLVLLLGAAILIAAPWGAFQTHGYYHRQPAWGKAALIFAVMLGCVIVATAGAVLVGNFLSGKPPTGSRSNYAIIKTGAVIKITQGPGSESEIVDLEGKPLLNATNGHKVDLAEFNLRLGQPFSAALGLGESRQPTPWTEADTSSAVGWSNTPDTLWYYWLRYGRLIGYDIATRRCIGSLGPHGFTSDLPGGGDRFSDAIDHSGRRTLPTATILYRLDLEKRAAHALFTTTSDDPIIAYSEIAMNNYDWTYTAVVTKRFVYLLTAEGQPVWKIPYESKTPPCRQVQIYFLEPPGQFAVWMEPLSEASNGENQNLPTHAVWVASDQGVIRSTDLPALPPYLGRPNSEEILACSMMPPAGWLALPWIKGATQITRPPRELLLLNWAVAALVCLPIGLWLGRRYRFSFAAHGGWAVFHLLFGVPGLLAFLSVQEWPAREACPNCKGLRLVDREQCEHCGAEWALPAKTGTEVFAPLVSSS